VHIPVSHLFMRFTPHTPHACIHTHANTHTLAHTTTKPDQSAMTIAKSPGKSLFMTMIMLWMSGSTLQLFSIMIMAMSFWTPLKGLFAMKQGTFLFACASVYVRRLGVVLLCVFVFVAVNDDLMCYNMYWRTNVPLVNGIQYKHKHSRSSKIRKWIYLSPSWCTWLFTRLVCAWLYLKHKFSDYFQHLHHICLQLSVYERCAFCTNNNYLLALLWFVWFVFELCVINVIMCSCSQSYLVQAVEFSAGRVIF